MDYSNVGTFNAYSRIFFELPNYFQDQAISILAALPEPETAAAVSQVAQQVIRTPRTEIFQLYASRFSSAPDETQESLLLIFARGLYEVRFQQQEAVQILSSLRISTPAQVAPKRTAPTTAPAPKRNRVAPKALPKNIQDLILEERLYLSYVDNAVERINSICRTHYRSSTFSTAYQATGSIKTRWPARDVNSGTINREEAHERVVKKFGSQ